jgi:hypothetical protein
MLADQLDKIDVSLLSQVCSEQWDETPTLEFKAVLPQPAPDDKPKQEFLKDVAALANAGGGDIVYGISEISGKANALVPIQEAAHPIDATRRRLRQWLESGVEPRISGIDVHSVQHSHGKYVLVIRVPVSFQRPHRSRVGAHWQWPVRSGTHTADLTYPQIRDAFDRGATLGERARKFRDERLTAILSGTTGRPLQSGPRCIVHLIPLAAIAGEINVDLKQLHPGPYAQFMGFGWGGATRSFNLDGLVVYPGGANAEKLVYTQIFRTGCLEAARFVGALREAGGMAIPSGVASGHIRESLEKFLIAAKSWGISGPAIAAAAVLDVHGWQFAYQSRGYFSAANSADRPHLVLPEVWIEDLSTAQLDAIVRPIVDTLWQAFDLEDCPFYDARGSWIMH